MLKITLTNSQIIQIRKATGHRVTVTLTSDQFREIKKHFPNLSNPNMELSLGTMAAPFIPGGSVLSAAISGLSQNRAVGRIA